MRRKDWSALQPRTQAQYQRVLERAFGKKAPSYVPAYEEWPESSRVLLRAAIQAYWTAREQPEKGLVIAAKIKKGRTVEREPTWPTPEEGNSFEAASARVGPRAAFLITRLCLRLGLRSEEMLSTPRAKWQAALRWGRLTVLGKGNKERTLQAAQLRLTIEELLALPAHSGHSQPDAAPSAWNVPGEVLARLGSKLGTQRNLLDRYLKRVAVSAGLDPAQWHPHTLRHVFTERLLGDGGTLRDAQFALGHARLETLERYTHPTPESVGRKMRGD